MKRFKAEYGEQKDFDTEETIKSEIQKIRDEVFNIPFEDSSKEIISKFQTNFLKLKSFMEKIDTKIAGLGVFN